VQCGDEREDEGWHDESGDTHARSPCGHMRPGGQAHWYDKARPCLYTIPRSCPGRLHPSTRRACCRRRGSADEAAFGVWRRRAAPRG